MKCQETLDKTTKIWYNSKDFAYKIKKYVLIRRWQFENI